MIHTYKLSDHSYKLSWMIQGWCVANDPSKMYAVLSLLWILFTDPGMQDVCWMILVWIILNDPGMIYAEWS
jgi:hypothetical protein